MNQDHNWPLEVIVKLDQPFLDERGCIQPLLDLRTESALIINSSKGSVRANHYHKTDWHYCYVISGQIDYFHRPVGTTASPKKVSVKKGELFFTPPLVEHAMLFTEDTTFLTLSRNQRNQNAYEEDLVRVKLI